MLLRKVQGSLLCLCWVRTEKPIPGSLPLVTGRRWEGSGKVWLGSPARLRHQTLISDQRQEEQYWSEGGRPPWPSSPIIHHHDRRQWPHVMEHRTLNLTQPRHTELYAHSLTRQSVNSIWRIFIHFCVYSLIDCLQQRKIILIIHKIWLQCI